MSRRLAVALATVAIVTGAGASAQAAPTPLPGPRVPIEHIGVSGAHFSQRSGNPGCYTGAGSVHHGFEVPRGATILGVTAYVVDTQTVGSISVELSRHDFASGGSYLLAKGNSVNGYDTTVDLKLSSGYTVSTGEGVNVVVSIPDGTCFKGAELHYLPAGVNPTPDGARQAPSSPDTKPDSAPDGSPAKTSR